MGLGIPELIEKFNYVGIGLLMFLENVFPPIPSELIMPLSGYVARQGKLTLWGVILVGTIGSCLGQLPLYYLGRYLGCGRLKCWLDKHPWLAISPSELEKADAWFDRHGRKAVLFCRLIPGLRSLISIPAGICGMNLQRFLIYTSGGTLIWTGLLAWAGWLLGERNNLVDRYLHPISTAVLVIIAVFYLWRVVKRYRSVKQKRNRS